MNAPQINARPVRLSHHAALRADERFPRLGSHGLLESLASQGVETASRPLGNIANILVWSKPDQRMVLAITSRHNGTVITVLDAVHCVTGKRRLLTEWHDDQPGTLVWTGLPRRRDMRRAIELAGDRIPSVLAPLRPAVPPPKKKFRLQLRYVTDLGRGLERAPLAAEGIEGRGAELRRQALAMLARLRDERAGEHFLSVVAEVCATGEAPVWEWDIADLRSGSTPDLGLAAAA